MPVDLSNPGFRLLEAASYFDVADLYTLKHLPKHLAEAGEVHTLLSLLIAGPQWMTAKRSRFGSDFSYQQDLLLAFQTVIDSNSANALIDLTTLVTPLVHLTSRSFNYSDKYIKALTWLGKHALALDYARLRPGLSSRFESISLVHAVLAGIGSPNRELLAELHDIAQLLNSPEMRDRAFVYLAQTTAKAGDVASSEAYALGIEDAEVRDDAYQSLADALLRRNEWRSAEVVIEQITTSRKRAVVRANLAATLANLGNFPEAENVALSLRSPRRRLFALRHLAVALSRLCGAAAARPSLARMAKELESIIPPVRRIQEIQDMWPTLQAVGAIEELDRSYMRATKEIQEVPQPASKAQLYRRQAHIASDIGEQESADEYLRQALLYIEKVDHAQQRAALFTAVGQTALHCGFQSLAENAFERSLSVIHRIADQNWLDFELAQLARATVSYCTDLACSALGQIVVDSKRRETALDLIPLLVQNRQVEVAEGLLRTINEDLGTSITSPSISYRDEVLRRLSRTLATAGHEDKAARLLECMADPLVRVQALLDQAVVAPGEISDCAVACVVAMSRAVVAESPAPPRRDKALVLLAKSLAFSRQTGEAMQVADLIGEQSIRKQTQIVLVETVSRYSKEMACDLLDRVSKMLSVEEDLESSLRAAAMHLSLGRLQGAMRLVQSIRERDEQVLFVGRLGLRVGTVRRFLGLRLMAHFRRSLGSISDSGKMESGRALLIRWYLALGLRKRAAKEILRFSTPSLPGNVLHWTSHLSVLTEALMDCGEERSARAILESAAKGATELQQSGERSRTLLLVSEAFLELGALDDSVKALACAVDAARQCSLPKNVYSLLRAAESVGRRGQPEASMMLAQEAFNLAVSGSGHSTFGALRAVASYCFRQGLSELGFRALARLEDIDGLLFCLSEMPQETEDSGHRALHRPLIEAIRILRWERGDWEKVSGIISEVWG